MGCCGKEVEDEDNRCGMIRSGDRKCRDVLCCIIFLVFWLGMAVIAIVGLSKGDPARLIYGKDFNETVCGTGELSDKKYLHYPRLTEDMLYALQNDIAIVDLKFYGFCVNECPQKGDSVCGYGVSDCWSTTLDTKEFVFRCLPADKTNTTIEAEVCTDPISASPDCTPQKKLAGGCTEICRMKATKTSTWKEEETVSNPVVDQMKGIGNLISRFMADVENTAGVVLLISGAGAFVAGIVFLIIFQYFASTMVWLTCIAVILCLTVLSLYCSIKGGILSPDDFSFLAFLENDQIPGLESAQGSEKSQFQVASYAMWTFTGIMLLIIVAMKSRIQIAVSIIKEASRCIKKMPLLVVWPLVPSVLMIGLTGYWLIISAYILTSDGLSVDDLTSSVNSVAGNNVVASPSNSTGLGKMSSKTTQDILFVYHLFGWLWTNQLLQAISICTIGGAVADYYWTRPDGNGKRQLGRFPIAASLKRTLRFSLGSLCFGSFIIAVVQLMRFIMEYIDRNTKSLQERNKFAKIALMGVKCCLWCFEKCLKFLSKNAYIIIAIRGSSFCTSARQAFTLILSNVARFAVVNSISYFMLLLAKITITCGATILIFTIITKSSDYMEGGEKEVSTPLAPSLIGGLLAWFVSSAFMNVYDMAIDTILLCFCMDSKLNNNGASEYMSPELQKIMGGTNTSKVIKVEEVKSKI